MNECKPLISGTAEQVAIAADAIRNIIEDGDKARGPRYGDRDDGYGDQDANAGQGLTLAHFPAQPEPFLTQNTP